MKKYNIEDNIILRLIFDFLVLFYSFGVLINCFIYTYYITFYIIVINIFLLLRYINIKNISINKYCEKYYILILILLVYVPFVTMVCFYKFNKEWMNKVILLILFLILLLVVILSYYSKLFFLLFLFILCLFLLIIVFYVGVKKLNIILIKNKFIISMLIGFMLFFFNNL